MSASGHPERRGWFLGLQQVPCGHPGADPAIEDAHVEAGPPQHPPRAAGSEGPGIVVDDDRQRRIDAERTEASAELVDVGQGMPAERRVGGRPGQDGFEVEEPGVGQVALQVAVEAAARLLAETPADIQQLRAAGLGGGQLIDGNQHISASGHA